MVTTMIKELIMPGAAQGFCLVMAHELPLGLLRLSRL